MKTVSDLYKRYPVGILGKVIFALFIRSLVARGENLKYDLLFAAIFVLAMVALSFFSKKVNFEGKNSLANSCATFYAAISVFAVDSDGYLGTCKTKILFGSDRSSCSGTGTDGFNAYLDLSLKYGVAIRALLLLCIFSSFLYSIVKSETKSKGLFGNFEDSPPDDHTAR